MDIKKITIPVDNQLIYSTIFVPDGNINKKTSIIFVHGWNSNEKKYLPLASQLVQLGFTCLSINLRGHNDSPFPSTQFSRQDHLNDINSAYAYMHSHFPENKIGILGKSYGGYLTVVLSGYSKLDFMIIVCPALYPDDQFNLPTSKLLIDNPDAFRTETADQKNNLALRTFYKFINPVLFIEVEHDDVVKKVSPKLYLQNTVNPLLTHKIIKDSDHPLTKPEWKAEFYTTVINWLKTTIL
jgi:uncharacterized protein